MFVLLLRLLAALRVSGPCLNCGRAAERCCAGERYCLACFKALRGPQDGRW
jgi:hypothetical protein